MFEVGKDEVKWKRGLSGGKELNKGKSQLLLIPYEAVKVHQWLFYSTLLAIISTSLNLCLFCKINTTWLFSSQSTCNLVQVKNFATPPLHPACSAIIGSLVEEVVKNTKTPRFRFSDWGRNKN